MVKLMEINIMNIAIFRFVMKKVVCGGSSRLIILTGRFSLKQNLSSKLVLLLANPVVQRS